MCADSSINIGGYLNLLICLHFNIVLSLRSAPTLLYPVRIPSNSLLLAEDLLSPTALSLPNRGFDIKRQAKVLQSSSFCIHFVGLATSFGLFSIASNDRDPAFISVSPPPLAQVEQVMIMCLKFWDGHRRWHRKLSTPGTCLLYK